MINSVPKLPHRNSVSQSSMSHDVIKKNSPVCPSHFRSGNHVWLAILWFIFLFIKTDLSELWVVSTHTAADDEDSHVHPHNQFLSSSYSVPSSFSSSLYVILPNSLSKHFQQRFDNNLLHMRSVSIITQLFSLFFGPNSQLYWSSRAIPTRCGQNVEL